MTETSSRLTLFACFGLAAATLAVALSTYRDYGVTWDEGVQSRYGELVVEYFRSGSRDQRANEFVDLHYYGPAFEAVAALAYEGRRAQRFEIRHLGIALIGWLAFPALMWASSRTQINLLAPLAGLALWMTPRFWGHMFNNSKDIPFAAGFTLAMAALVWVLVTRGKRWAPILVAGVAMGLTLALRPGGLPLVGVYWAFALAGCLAMAGPEAWRDRKVWLDLGLRGAVGLALAWGIMVAGWPWAHEAPFANPIRAAFRSAEFFKAFPVLFAGELTPSDQLPATYLITYLLIATPLPILVLAGVGLAGSVREQRRCGLAPVSAVFGLFQLWFALPLMLYVIVRPNAYDGMRHFLFVLPAMAFFAALGIHTAASLLPRGRSIAVAVLVLTLLFPALSLIRLHPYQSSYFNALVGGLGGAAGRYETDYWISSYREAMLWINDRAAEQGRGHPLQVLIAANQWSITGAQAYAAPSVKLHRLQDQHKKRSLPQDFDYFLATTRYFADRHFPEAPIVHRIGREGATFTVIKGQPPQGDRVGRDGAN
jgi:4-amino-4-deoxy-L-arabinose transferase-like glycosyltransferase